MHGFFDHPVVIPIIVAILTLICKWVWDRWLSTSSRITMEHCKLIRENCQHDLLAKIRSHNERLNDGDDTFKSTRHIQRAVLLTLLQMCKHMEVDCDELSKAFIDQDILE